jgi:hypothetical protein
MNNFKSIFWPTIGLLLFVTCIFVTLYCSLYVYGYGAILEFILGNVLQGIVRLACGFILTYYIWRFDKGLVWQGIFYCFCKLI